jgi:hypothetical protein
MDLADLPENGLVFLSLKNGGVFVTPALTAHFDLLPAAAGSDDWSIIEKWLLRERPRLGRIGRRGGQLDLLTLTKPLKHHVAASEDEEEELDLVIRARVLSSVLTVLRRI